MKKHIVKYFLTGSERTINIKKNIIGSFGIKGLGILISFLLVPFTINLLNQEKYGIWITIFSIVTWFNVMDIGLGNGFRNKFTEAMAIKNEVLAKKYIQTLYSSMFLITGILLIFFFIVNHFLNWNRILNIPRNFDENIDFLVGTVFVLLCAQLILKNISTILLSLQKTTFSNSLILFGNLLSLIFIFVFNKIYTINLFSIAIIFMMSPIIVFIIATIIIFSKELKHLRPKFFAIPQKKYFNELMTLGLKFFLIQITTIVMFSSSSIIITQLYGPSAVTPYNVTYQLFAAAQIFFSIIITPFWSAFTEANAKNDYVWIKTSLKKLMFIWSVFSVGIIILWLISPFVFKIWLGSEIIIPLGLSFQFALFAILMAWSSIFASYLAGIGKILISLYGAIFQCVVNIPLAIFLAKGMDLGTSGIIMATNINMLIPVLLLSLQTNKIINKKAYGIWNR
jgi:O-antigen/teichoic acid export membrane protein